MTRKPNVTRSQFFVAIVCLVCSLGLGLSTQAFGKQEKLYHTNSSDGATPKIPVYDFSKLVARIKPAVFNITVTGHKKLSAPFSPTHGPGLFDFFFRNDEMFRPIRPYRQRHIPIRSSGSGFLIHEKGFALTNEHVVRDAKQIKVKLQDNREFDAKVVGQSKLLDLALLKIKAPRGTNFPYAYLGTSEPLKVGEPVIAIGNAKGLGLTVTAGIISAKGRVIGSGQYDDYIQTDAAINQGNSGGPLFNRKGEVVGINTAILRGGRGIGFAIPVDLVRQVLPQLHKRGSIERAQLGVKVQRLTSALAQSFGLAGTQGALVTEVAKDSAAAKAGVRVGDVLLKVNNRTVRNHRHLSLLVAFQPPQTKVVLHVMREKKLIHLNAVLQKWSDVQEAMESQHSGRSKQKSLTQLGVQLGEIPSNLRRRHNLPKTGVQVKQVTPGSLAASNGMKVGDLLLEINNTPVRSTQHVRSLLAAQDPQKPTLFLLRRGDTALFLAFNIE